MGMPDFERVGFTKPAAKNLTQVVGVASVCAGILFAGYSYGQKQTLDNAHLEKLCTDAVNEAVSKSQKAADSTYATKSELEAEKTARNEAVYTIKLEQESKWNAFLQRAWAKSP